MHDSEAENLSRSLLSKFIATEPLDKVGEAGERAVWEAVQGAFCDRECLAYWRYPIFSQRGKYRKEPDILIVDREWGAIIIEVKSLAIAQIASISGHLWEYHDYYAATGNPYQQAENQLFALLEYSDREPTLQRQVSGRALVALPKINRQEWQERGFDRLPTSPPLLFQEDLCEGMRDRLIKTPPLVTAPPLTEEQWQLLLAVVAGTPLYRPPSRRVLARDRSRGKILQQANEQLLQLDLEQERIAKQIPPGPQRIRGLAGSGKTVLLCQKAAHIHLKHPHWQVGFVFFSRSLYPLVIAQIDKWLRYFSQNEVGYDADNRNLRVLHAWGAKGQPGLYSFLCRQAGVKPLTVKNLRTKQPNEALAEACCYLLNTAAIPQCFDALLLDEGQDLIVDRCKFEGKQPFYWLAYQSLRPVDPALPHQRRLIWTCDEMQSLESLTVPCVSELFGEELAHLVAGSYSNGIPKSEVLSRCYRTPHRILTAAHAIAMGWLRPGGMLTGMQCPEDWRAIGYEVRAPATLHRPPQNSPNPISHLWQGDCLEFKTFPNRQQELSYLARHSLDLLRHEGLRPSQEILVIVLGNFLEARQLEIDVANFLIQQGIDVYLPGTNNYNTISCNKEQYNPNSFWFPGAITISRIHRAKGHEADLVYIVGLDKIAVDESNLKLRNQLLIALTRARGWAVLSGIGNYSFYDEMRNIMQRDETFSIAHRYAPQRKLAASSAGELLQSYQSGNRNFRNWNLEKAELENANLKQIDLLGANLRSANLQGANLDKAKLIAADLKGARLKGASLNKVQLIGANLQDSDLTAADLRGANLSDARLEGAILSGANLNAVELTGTILLK
ncbi:pentapeptide repeat-containing protein [Oscillatoria sp. FACHB-1406]|uniref:pentapeptide repeat-containing protein n=1 Tax=Oscillatoria sp. FACHB-1406 TaxID=2692846 RepID=UPI001683D5FD|nr:pentapeptide repeat-containing protein [Oscillatoria sp. FACHB-1406]MBD2578056.1 pentapeptide repeat-containing protein [Oscillatoria sp. FACHB-1406]